MTDGSKGSILVKLIALIVNLMFFALLFGGCGQKEPAEKASIPIVKVFHVKNISKIVTPNYPGKASATQETDLSFLVSGSMVQFPVKVGDEVREGDLMARIDPRDFENTLRMTQAQLDVATASLRLAELEYRRVQKIRQREAEKISRSLINQKREIYNQRRVEVESLIASVSAAKKALSYTSLHAPFDGTVAETFVNNYEYIHAQRPVVRLIDISTIEFSVEIPDTYISLMSQIDKVIIQFEAYPSQGFLGRIKEIGKESSKTAHTSLITLVLKQPAEYRILAGMSGHCHFEFQLNKESNYRSIEIPSKALFQDSEGQHGIWIIAKENQTVSFRIPQLGVLTQDGIIILAGLQPGDRIVTDSDKVLHEGDLVRIMPSESLVAK